MHTSPTKFRLSTGQANAIEKIYHEAFSAGVCTNYLEAIGKANALARHLPAELAHFIHDQVSDLSRPAFIISGLPVSMERKTPTAIANDQNSQIVNREEFIHILLSAVIGQVFTYDSIQNGNYVNNVFPIEGNATKAISSGFTSDFDFHTEDAFHPMPGDFLGLFCMKNPDSVPTTIAFVDDFELDDELLDFLFTHPLEIKPNIAHSVSNAAIRKTTLLYGSKDKPYLRVNFNLLNLPQYDDQTRSMLERLKDKMRQSKQGVTLAPGDILYIDNLRTAHGRDAYSPRFDGHDRWLLRLYITTLWRLTVPYRVSIDSFVLRGEAA